MRLDERLRSRSEVTDVFGDDRGGNRPDHNAPQEHERVVAGLRVEPGLVSDALRHQDDLILAVALQTGAQEGPEVWGDADDSNDPDPDDEDPGDDDAEPVATADPDTGESAAGDSVARTVPTVWRRSSGSRPACCAGWAATDRSEISLDPRRRRRMETPCHSAPARRSRLVGNPLHSRPRFVPMGELPTSDLSGPFTFTCIGMSVLRKKGWSAPGDNSPNRGGELRFAAEPTKRRKFAFP